MSEPPRDKQKAWHGPGQDFPKCSRPPATSESLEVPLSYRTRVSKAGSEILHDWHTSQGIHALYTLVCQNLWPNYPTGYETLR